MNVNTSVFRKKGTEENLEAKLLMCDKQYNIISGAYNITREAQQRSQRAQAKVDSTQMILDESERIRAETEQLLQDGQERFDNQLTENKNNLASLDASVNGLSSRVADINEMASIHFC